MNHAPADLLARFGSPLYAYDGAVLESALAAFGGAFAGIDARYALKANANAVLLRRIAAAGFGADAVSPAEVRAAQIAGFPNPRISYTGHATAREELAAVHALGAEITVDSAAGLQRLAAVAPGVACGLRVNTGVGAGHHSNVITGGAQSKFGVPVAELGAALELADSLGLRVVGLHQHVGSGILAANALLAAADALLRAAALHAQRFTWIDFGGGFGLPYRAGEAALDLGAVAAGLRERVARFAAQNGVHPQVRVQPGRILVAACGTLLTRVTEVKRAHETVWVATDTGAHHLLRPMLYDAHHEIENLSRPSAPLTCVTVTGVLCESGDVLARARMLPLPCEGDILAIRDVGAYGFAMASTYNLRARPAEVLLTDGAAQLIRVRETEADLLR